MPTYKKIYVGSKKIPVLIDMSDWKIIEKYQWNVLVNGYVANTKVGYLHRFIMGSPKGNLIDHINRNPLDNRKRNLRVVNRSQNGINRKSLNSNNTSGVRGVWWHSKGKRWGVEIKVNKRKIWIGLFLSFEQARKARKQAEIKYWGKESKYAKL